MLSNNFAIKSDSDSNIYYLTVSVGQELVGTLWMSLRVSHKAAVKLLAGAAHGEALLPALLCGSWQHPIFSTCWLKTSGPFHIGLFIVQLTTGQLASLNAKD